MLRALKSGFFNRVQFVMVKNEAGLNCFIMTPTKWTKQMNAVGTVVKFVINVKGFRTIKLRICWNIQKSIRKSARKHVLKKAHGVKKAFLKKAILEIMHKFKEDAEKKL